MSPLLLAWSLIYLFIIILLIATLIERLNRRLERRALDRLARGLVQDLNDKILTLMVENPPSVEPPAFTIEDLRSVSRYLRSLDPKDPS